MIDLLDKFAPLPLILLVLIPACNATYYIGTGVVSSQHLFSPFLSVIFDLEGPG